MKEETLVAYLKPNLTVKTGDLPSSDEAWKAFAKKKLPHYMVPSYYLILESFPQTANGKLDRKLFPVPPLLLQVKLKVSTTIISVSIMLS